MNIEELTLGYAGATKYYVFQRQGAGAFAYVGTALGTSWDAIGLAPTTAYSFRIQAVDAYEIASVESSTQLRPRSRSE